MSEAAETKAPGPCIPLIVPSENRSTDRTFQLQYRNIVDVLDKWLNLLGGELDYDYGTTEQPMGKSSIMPCPSRVFLTVVIPRQFAH